MHGHQYTVDDGRGHLITVEPNYLVSGNNMWTLRGPRHERLGNTLQRKRDGRLDLRTRGPIDDRSAHELAISLALGDALGTRTLKLKNLPLTPLLFFVHSY